MKAARNLAATACVVFGLLRNVVASSSVENFCTKLVVLLEGKVWKQGNLAYDSSIASYWSAQEEKLYPSCVIIPTNSEDVSIVVKALASANLLANDQLQFAVRSGGHDPAPGSANINRGVTIDLSKINEVVVNANETITSIGPGATWGKVYSYLDAIGLSVSGGRVSGVGVGGLTTGGGISYFSPRYGFVCDNVVNYEIVLASGEIVNANANENHDLWIALKGGSNNFGVITRFDVNTFQQGKIWGGNIFYLISTLQDQLQAFATFAGSADYDPYSSLIQSFAYVSSEDIIVVNNNLIYTQALVNPPTFQPFTNIQPQIANTMRTSNLTDFTVEINLENPYGFRKLWVTATFEPTLPFLEEVFGLYNSSIQSLVSVSNLNYSLSLEPIPIDITAKTSPLGGNSLGLDPSSGPLVVALFAFSWVKESDDAQITATAKALSAKLDTTEKKASVFNRFKYLNYAAPFQDPIDGYGAASKAHLQAASRKYDPQSLFQKALPGGYKTTCCASHGSKFAKPMST